MENREWFVFYYSFYKAISQVPAENQLELYEAIAQYSFTFTEPENLTWISAVLWDLIKPQLDANNKRYLDWCKWWRPKKETTGIKHTKTTGFEKKETTLLQNGKPKEKEKEKVKDKEKENNKLSTIVDNEQSSYWDRDINQCLEIIKKYNNWLVDWTVKEQRMYWKNLIWKLKMIDSVKNWDYTRDEILNIILTIVSQNEYHAQKISWPKRIYYELWWLMQICKSEFAKKKKQEIPFIPWV